MKKAQLKHGKIFITTMTYRVWQTVCRLRDRLRVTLGVGQEYSYRKPTDELIIKYILPSKTFALWFKMFSARVWIFNHLINPAYIVVKRYIPQPIKQKLKVFFSVLSGHTTVIDPRIMREWNAWVYERPNDSLDIINFGVIPYDYRFQRPQQLAKAVADEKNRVFYIETEFNVSFLASRTKIKVKKLGYNTYSVTLSAPSNYFIYTDTASRKGVEMMFSSLKILHRKARIVNPIAKIDHPFWGALSDMVGMPIVYDVMDLHQGFKITGKTVEAKHEELVNRADMVVVSSDYLEKTVKHAQNVIHIKNAGDYDHFVKAAKKQTGKPADLRSITDPILGYYGAVAEWFDVDLIERTAKEYPHVAIVIIGRIQNEKIRTLAKKYSQIHLLGEKPYAELPSYVAHFAACMIPFHLTDLIKATNPVKIYEYFAAGKPVVATEIPELKMYKDQVYLSKSAKEFVVNVGKALDENAPKRIYARQKVARENTWESRAEMLIEKLKSLAFPKVSVIMLSFNNAEMTRNAIESVLSRSQYGNMEVIVVDNASDKKTVSMLKKFAGNNVKVVFNARNYGFAKGNNVGLKRAKGEYLVLLNNDVIVTPGWMERLVYHTRSEGLGLVGPVTNSIGNESQIDIKYDADNQKEIETHAANYTYAHWGESLELERIAAFCWLMPRSVYEHVGDLDERFGRGLFEDDDYCMRIKNEGYAIACAEDSFVHHYGGASTDWGSTEYQELFETNKKKFEKKWGITWTPHKHRNK